MFSAAPDQPSYYLRLAYEFAKRESQDRNTQNGALIVSRRSGSPLILFKGANVLPNGIRPTRERIDTRPLKYSYFVHAEENVILQAARSRTSLYRTTLYCPYAACDRCARMIIQSGIERVVVHKQAMDRTPERWQESVAIAKSMLAEAGVEYELYDGPVGADRVLMDGKFWNP